MPGETEKVNPYDSRLHCLDLNRKPPEYVCGVTAISAYSTKAMTFKAVGTVLAHAT